MTRTQLVSFRTTRVEWVRAPAELPRISEAERAAIWDVRGFHALALLRYEEAMNWIATCTWEEVPELKLRAYSAFHSTWEWSRAEPRVAEDRPGSWFLDGLVDAVSAVGTDQESCCNSPRKPECAIACAEQQATWSERQAAHVIGRAWRESRPPRERTQVSWWDAKRIRTHGKLAAHASFLQFFFRESRRRRPGCWSRGGLAGLGRLAPRTEHRCKGGKALADESDFEEQAARAEAMLLWYEQYVTVLRRLQSGDTPSVLHLFGGGGGSSEGGRRAGASGFSVDCDEQPDKVRRFGTESFVKGDATSWSVVGELQKKHGFAGCLASPPCKPYSRALSGGTSIVPELIPQTRDLLRTFFDHWAIENVMGASRHMAEGSVELFGQAFGCRVDRARKIEASFRVRIDEAVLQPGIRLRRRTCLGARRRWRQVDRFERPMAPCCAGNIFAVQGTAPWRCTTAECAKAMGLDVDHMSYDRLAQSLPPSYTRLIIGQMCMAIACQRFGVPPISYDEHVANPEATRRALAGWLVGAGDDRASAGLELRQAVSQADDTVADHDVSQVESWDQVEVPGASEDAFRELEYSHVGGFDQWGGPPAVGEWLSKLRPSRRVGAAGEAPHADDFVGRNSYIHADTHAFGLRGLHAVLEPIRAAAAANGRGTRATVAVREKHVAWLGRLGFWRDAELPAGPLAQEALAGERLVYMTIGKRGSTEHTSRLDHERCRAWMDPRDRGESTWADVTKRERAWRPVRWEPDGWLRANVPPSVREIMTQGAKIELRGAVRPGDIPQYAFPSSTARMEASWEADRAIATGHMSYVPADEIEVALAMGAVHPWTMAQQGSKWRACQDYSGGTNRAAFSAPFGLPTPWDVRRLVRPGRSSFVKYDLRDGFWGVPVAKESKNYLLMRHPATGRLMRCDRLPFGYIDSPRVFCSVTEAIAQLFRERAAGKGVHIWCYVDDYLIMGDDEELASWGADLFENILLELGFEFAPHKQRGPCRCIEFLGLLIANFEEVCCIALSEERQRKMNKLISEWLARRPKSGTYVADPTELSRLLGLLVFASQVVPGGRVYMQGMLSQFKGLEVDWRRGLVRPTRGTAWSKVPVSGAFWRDLEWWADSFADRNCTSLLDEERGEAAITGTDASDWGTGQVAWIDGGKEESRLRFGPAERRRPINWRELLGIVRVIELYGRQLAGKCVLVETDNMAAKWTADRTYSKASDMQELTRRLHEAAERHGIRLRFTHTPGVKLHRPDQTSRGDPIEEPRARVGKSLFATLSRRFGPFTEMLGAERQHRQEEAHTDAPRLWVHPTYTTVGSAMRLVGERLMAPSGERARGVMIVPDAPQAQWGQLLRHFTVVGRRPEGGAHLEMSRLGAWRKVLSKRPSLILSFPRHSGEDVRRVCSTAGDETDRRRVGESEGGHLALSKGSMVYRPPPNVGQPGGLYIVWDDFDPEPSSEEPEVRVAELLAVPDGKKKNSLSGIYAVDNSIVTDEYGRRPASFGGVGCRPWGLAAGELWVVDHLTSETEPTWKMKPLKAGAGQAAQWARKAFKFDFATAERAIAFARSREQVACPPCADDEVLASEAPGVDVRAQVARVERAVAAAEMAASAGLQEATADLAAARISADEAAEARQRPPPPQAREARPAAPVDRAGPARVPCRYPGIECYGCSRGIKQGEQMVVVGDGYAHAPPPGEEQGSCVALARQRLLKETKAAADARKARSSKLSSDKRQAQLDHRFSPDMIGLAKKCLDGS